MANDLISVAKIEVGFIRTNCYIVWNNETLETLIIDPGAESHKILKVIEYNRLIVKMIINTHGHADHILANERLKNHLKIKLLIHELDNCMLKDPNLNLSKSFGFCLTSPYADEYLFDGQNIKLGNVDFVIIHTPGHTPGSICIYTRGLLFSGDTLFFESVGRTDMPGGDNNKLLFSIQDKLFSLPEETEIFPGHGQVTTILHEKSINCCLNDYLNK